MPTPLSYPFEAPVTPNQNHLGMQRGNALSRILHFESVMHRRMGQNRPIRYTRLYRYYTSQNLPPDNVQQPLMINYVKAIVDKHASYLWGQWTQNGKIMDWSVRPRNSADPEDATSPLILRHLDDLFAANDRETLLWEGGHNCGVYGDTIFRLRWDDTQRRVVFENLLPEWVHFRWNVTNMNEITEAIVSFPIDRADAKEQYGTAGNPAINYNIINPDYISGFGIFWEHWTPLSYRQWIDDVLIREEPNPYCVLDKDGKTILRPGIIPFVHIPNMRVGGEFFGWADAEAVLYLQDELNRRMADVGDALNNFAHPVTLLKNFKGEVDELYVGPDAVWQMGPDADAEYLQWKGSPPTLFEYIQKIQDILYDTANMPDIAFGRMVKGSSGGSSKGMSGIALQIALMPVIERATMKRIFWGRGLKRLAHLATFMHAMMDPASLPFNYSQYGNYDIQPVFASILPRDRLQAVNENVALSAGGLRSTERALEDLGEHSINDETEKIKKDLEFKAKLGVMANPPVPSTPSAKGGKNSDKGRGGSPSLPGGPGASNRKSGAGAKEAS